MGNETMVPMAAYEAAQARHSNTVRTLIICWTVSIVVLVFALMVSLSYTEEAVDEIVTTEVEQAADNAGQNYFANGDLINGGQADSQGN